MCNLSEGIENDGRVSELAALVHDGALDEDVAAARAANYGVDRDDFRERVKNYKPEKNAPRHSALWKEQREQRREEGNRPGSDNPSNYLLT